MAAQAEAERLRLQLKREQEAAARERRQQSADELQHYRSVNQAYRERTERKNTQREWEAVIQSSCCPDK